MLDRDLAELYATPAKSLNLAVKQHARRFPEDFMFRLRKEEWQALRLQAETSNIPEKKAVIVTFLMLLQSREWSC